jgi:mono/diheme cytochrome c family protein
MLRRTADQAMFAPRLSFFVDWIMRTLWVALAGVGALGVGLWAGAGPAGAVAPSAETGAEIAARWCAGCHVVSPTGAGTDAAPSFAAIARDRDPAQMRGFLSKPHVKPMQGLNLSSREIEDVIAYIQTLGK